MKWPRFTLRKADQGTAIPLIEPSGYRPPTLAEHFAPIPPKRVLALDGGGVRGIMTVAMLERIEELLQERLEVGPQFRLCDYFDLIGGTSTGSIIATLLALGRSSAEVKALYFDMGPKVFRFSAFRKGLLFARFNGQAFRRLIGREVGNVDLGSDKIRTGLAFVARRVNTASNWVVFNNPKSKFYDDGPGAAGKFTGNRHYALRDLVRASTAAPYYFKPQRIRIGRQEEGLFIDGGLTLHNNPALQLLMLTSMKGYQLNWPLGVDKLFMLSLGTGEWREHLHVGRFNRQMSIAKAAHALVSTISTGQDLVETMMQWIGKSERPRHINSEIGDLANDLLAGQPLLTYQRYNAVLLPEWLRANLGIHMTDEKVRQLWNMADASMMQDLYEIGRKLADRFILPEHFPVKFDPEFQ